MQRKGRNADVPDYKKADRLCSQMAECANCVEGKVVVNCKNREGNSEFCFADHVLAATEEIEKLQDLAGPTATARIRQRVNGFRVQNAITGEYKSKKAISLISTAKELTYSIEFFVNYQAL